ncbi:hypothetical protein [Streptomyces microflavus]|uniref:hypothetical protein n=1 Tax=Streptomyces microflavus TaxID=1919 RepID=UPI003326BAAD
MPGATDGRGRRTEKADCTLAAQPSCNTIATPPVCTPTGTSDHAPVYGSIQGGPGLDWRMNGTASGGSLGLTGTPSPGAPWSTGHGGALELDGVSGAVTAPGPVVDTRRSFTVSAWAKADGPDWNVDQATPVPGRSPGSGPVSPGFMTPSPGRSPCTSTAPRWARSRMPPPGRGTARARGGRE